MNWVIAHAGGVRCGSCGAAIGQGEPYATVTAAQLRRCAECMKKTFEAEPPAELWAKTPETDVLPDVFREAQARMATKGEVRDGKLAQLTEHDQ